MNEVIQKGHVEKVPEDQLLDEGQVWYIPPYAVYHPRLKTIRVVFDCAASFKATSLNNELLQGPDLSNTLLSVLLKFQPEPIVLMANTEGTFVQVRVPPQDVDFLSFLWWPDVDVSQQLAEYGMTVHLFSAISSPRCASFALSKTVEDTIRRNVYVDDCLKSIPTDSEAVTPVGDLRAAVLSWLSWLHYLQWRR